jgi:hypothetical protein
VRVQSLQCPRSALDVIYNISDCYTSLTLRNVETSWVSSNGMKLSEVPDSLKSAYMFQDASQTDEILNAGNYGLYPGNRFARGRWSLYFVHIVTVLISFIIHQGSGFLIELTDAETARYQIAQLQRYSWVDGKTRGIFIDCAFYNSNLEAWLVSR